MRRRRLERARPPRQQVRDLVALLQPIDLAGEFAIALVAAGDQAAPVGPQRGNLPEALVSRQERHRRQAPVVRNLTKETADERRGSRRGHGGTYEEHMPVQNNPSRYPVSSASSQVSGGA